MDEGKFHDILWDLLMKGNDHQRLRQKCSLHDMRHIVQDAYSAALQTSQWRPISEAPRDGTVILCGKRVRDGDGTIEWVAWSNWFVCNWGWNGNSYEDPTHFMPLPEPPTEEE